jgi:ATP-dependent RNA helicase DDX41
MPLIANEGPLGILLAPSRELARQTFELVQELCEAFQPGLLRSQLLIGGESVRDQLELVRRSGVHCVVATPGRKKVLPTLWKNKKTHPKIDSISIFQGCATC